MANDYSPSSADWLNGLSMWDVLAALHRLGGYDRSQLVANATQTLTQRGRTDSAQRITWAAEVVELGALPTWTPPNLPLDRVESARQFLAAHARPKTGPPVTAEVKTAVSNAIQSGRIRGDNGQIAAVLKSGVYQGKRRDDLHPCECDVPCPS